MSKAQKRIDPNQLTIFDAIRRIQEREAEASRPAGSFDIDRQFREVISAAIKASPRSRYEIAARMSELIGQEITKTTLDSWTAESKDGHRFPAIFLSAFCEATGSSEPLKIMGRLVGVFIMPGPEALRAEIQKLEEEITKRQAEKKKRLMLLKEMGT